jgi:DNA recombination-dependent growth factor C
MAIINRLRFVDTLKERLGEDVSREFTDALQDEMAPMMAKEEIQMMISGLVDQFEARMWRVVAIATGLQLTALAVVAAILIAVLD